MLLFRASLCSLYKEVFLACFLVRTLFISFSLPRSRFALLCFASALSAHALRLSSHGQLKHFYFQIMYTITQLHSQQIYWLNITRYYTFLFLSSSVRVHNERVRSFRHGNEAQMYNEKSFIASQGPCSRSRADLDKLGMTRFTWIALSCLGAILALSLSLKAKELHLMRCAMTQNCIKHSKFEKNDLKKKKTHQLLEATVLVIVRVKITLQVLLFEYGFSEIFNSLNMKATTAAAGNVISNVFH